MNKWVASLMAGLIATVAGGLILHQLTSQPAKPDPPRYLRIGNQGERYYAIPSEAERDCGEKYFETERLTVTGGDGRYICF